MTATPPSPPVAGSAPEPASGPDPLGDDLAAAALALARRFAAAATLWCIAPRWPAHAQHVAVEFVHPVIVGKRAFPAVAVRGPDPVAELRASVRTGDVLLAVGAADDVVVADAMRRTPAWGVGTVWIGSGPRPAPGAADHVLWLEPAGDGPDDPLLPFRGRYVLAYHLLRSLSLAPRRPVARSFLDRRRWHPAPAHLSSARIWDRERAMRRDTCIWLIPKRSAICVWVRLP